MKSIYTLLFVIVSSLFQSVAQTISTAISFEEKSYDFGRILENKGKASHTFVFINKAKMPVAIDGITSGCGCTTADYTKSPVKPGSIGTVTVSFNPLYRPGFFSKEVVIYSNNRKNISRVWVKGTVIPFIHPVEEDYPYSFGKGLHLSLKVLAFGELKKGSTKQITLRYANDTNKPMTINFVVDGTNQNLKFTNPGKVVPKKRGEMIISYSQKKNIQSETVINIYPIVNGSRLPQAVQAKIIGINKE
jgi:hypothetical protein